MRSISESARRGPGTAHAPCGLISVMESDLVGRLTDAMIAGHADPTVLTHPLAVPVERWQELLHSWSEHATPLVREVLDARIDKLTSSLAVWDRLRSLFAVAGRYPDQTSAQSQEALRQEILRFGETLQAGSWFSLLLEIAPVFEQSHAAQIGGLQSAMVRLCEAGHPSPLQLSALGYLLLETVSRESHARFDTKVLDCMWSTFNRDGPHHDYTVGLAITRGLMLAANDRRVIETNRLLLSEVDGDPPWMLVALHRMGRSQEALTSGLGPGAEDWERLVARYTPPEH